MGRKTKPGPQKNRKSVTQRFKVRKSKKKKGAKYVLKRSKTGVHHLRTKNTRRTKRRKDGRKVVSNTKTQKYIKVISH